MFGFLLTFIAIHLTTLLHSWEDSSPSPHLLLPSLIFFWKHFQVILASYCLIIFTSHFPFTSLITFLEVHFGFCFLLVVITFFGCRAFSYGGLLFSQFPVPKLPHSFKTSGTPQGLAWFALFCPPPLHNSKRGQCGPLGIPPVFVGPYIFTFVRFM